MTLAEPRSLDRRRQRRHPPVPGEGHLHYYLDVEIPTAPRRAAVTAPGTYKATAEISMVWDVLPVGAHTFGAQLVHNNHTPLSPPVFDEVTVAVRQEAVATP